MPYPVVYYTLLCSRLFKTTMSHLHDIYKYLGTLIQRSDYLLKFYKYLISRSKMGVATTDRF